MRRTDPAAMAPHERLAELADLLGRGAMRLFANECKAPVAPRNSQDHLAALAAAEAQCGSNALNPKSTRATA